MQKPSISILYATETGVSETIAQSIPTTLDSSHFQCTVASVDTIADVESLVSHRCLIFVCSSTGQGDHPDSAGKFFRQLRRLQMNNSPVFKGVRYTILGLGDSNYQTFGAFPKQLHKVFTQLGATTFYDFALADDAVGLDIVVEPWIAGLKPALFKELGIALNEIVEEPMASAITELKIADAKVLQKDLFVPEKYWKLPNVKCVLKTNLSEGAVAAEDIFLECYHKTQKHFGSTSCVTPLPINSVSKLTSEKAIKDVYEIDIDGSNLSSLSDIQPGHSFSVLCHNSDDEVQKIIDQLQLNDDADKVIKIETKVPTHVAVDGAELTFRYFLKYCADIRAAPKKAFVQLLAMSCTDSKQKLELDYLSSFEGSNDFATLIRETQLSLLDLCRLFDSVRLSIEKLVEHLPPLKPRAYSVANYPGTSDKHLKFAFSIVHMDKENSLRQYDRYGVCTKYLLDRMKLVNDGVAVTLPVFTKSNQAFRLPDDLTVPLVFLSAGTGIAPYISFLEFFEKQKKETGQEPPLIWLFHGCRSDEDDFIYKSKIEEWKNSGLIKKVVVAFSRQEPTQPCGSRTYVQHKFLEYGEEIMELGPSTIFYVCGDAARMAPQLRETFVAMIEKHMPMNRDDALSLFKDWTKNGKYREDVWR